jgi:hypothetical protein
VKPSSLDTNGRVSCNLATVEEYSVFDERLDDLSRVFIKDTLNV